MAVADVIADDGDTFEWGKCDCARFAASVVERVTGRKFGREFAYATREDAEDIVSGSGSLVALVTNIVGTPPVADVRSLRDGDPVVLQHDPGVLVLGVKLGELVVFRTVRRASCAPVTRAIAGWRID
jgi:hypothetical protein